MDRNNHQYGIHQHHIGLQCPQPPRKYSRLQPATRVQQRQLAILKTEIRTPLHDILRRNLLIGSYAMLGTIRINPGMKLHATVYDTALSSTAADPNKEKGLSCTPVRNLLQGSKSLLYKASHSAVEPEKDYPAFTILLQFIKAVWWHRLDLLRTLGPDTVR